MFRRMYRKLHVVSQDKKHQLFVDCTVTSFASYLALKKTFGWSLTAVLSTVFRLEIIDWIVFVLAILCGYSAIAKVFYMVTTAFPASRVLNPKVEDLAHCCLNVNNEVQLHIQRIVDEPGFVSATFAQNHNFQSNIAIAADSLARHMLSTLTGAKAKDIFISVYQVPNFKELASPRTSLEYVCHYPHKNDSIVSKTIVFSDGAFKQYECVKCIEAPERTWAKFDCATYYKSKTPRHKKIKHYIGMKLMHNNILLGFVNIEFYNTTFFGSEDEIKIYLEENILTFRYLIEYQFLKRTFFHSLRPHLK